MQEQTETLFETPFEEEVHTGLTDYPKHLSSKYFYDEKGDKLFQDIMNMPEYYLTDAEFDIFSTKTEKITQLFSKDSESFNLIELGAGDGKKTKILLQNLVENKANFKYLPIDISPNVLDQLSSSLKTEIPEVVVKPEQGTYFEALENIASLTDEKKVILFLGSNIGNLLHPQAIDFLTQVRELMHKDDLFFVGFDQKKNPQTILDAYNDSTGITAAFNKNVLTRINSELEGNFDLDKFLHWEVYDPETGTAKSYLVAKETQVIAIKKLDLEVEFAQWETIHTEISQKYDDKTIEWLAEKSGLQVETQFTDSKNQYKNYVFIRA
ncbi:L-histidine N(alpha)-methyltransferase [Maribacter algarum]|uniref:L-histidine N(Alpha)-methyltransferase n=1 Tax=Maribacter algarum (ex Zhang et al. 2020) TaxID=2578118 RepID=A0A5S3PPI1_9FLAO|nr:L-histidine N(alpha)-methyltransferase [Maribacter algarum]TMM56281.1 L-histidine N(alpha)-methyltransferase [Maribacter algarum]